MSAKVSLENCADEQIQIPGAIQPHGALFAFDLSAKLCFVSTNADLVLGCQARLGESVTAQKLPLLISATILDWIGDPTSDIEPFELTIDGRDFDVLGHINPDHLLVVEFERRGVPQTQVASFSLIAYRSIGRIRRQQNVEDVLRLAAVEVRKITGFDRVMAYRFRHDDSGEVVRESKRPDLDSWEGHRYPSSDIPHQARQLYIANTLRLIADAHAATVPVVATTRAVQAPLDMSHCTLRAVSPIHIEYLNNMGVAASLSISIVIDGKLWGMIACHHLKPRQIPHGVRMACEMLGQIMSLTIDTLETRRTAMVVTRAAATLARIGTRARAADDMLKGVACDRPNPADLLPSDATLCLWGGKIKVCSGQVSPALIKKLTTALALLNQDMVSSAKVANTHPALAVAIKPYCGILAISIDVSQGGCVVWLRAEQIDNVRWAGKPEKLITSGPNGPRLSPRGSFREWREEVRGSSAPWDRGDIETAASLRSELNRIAGAHAIELERFRVELLAALGHDLRGPLQFISTAAQILQHPHSDASKLGARIQASSGRMSRLVMQILDMSRLQSTGITLDYETFDLVLMLREIVAEAIVSAPGIPIAFEAPDVVLVFADRDRLAQVISNLLSNAQHHGTQNQPIEIFVQRIGLTVSFGVANRGDPIPSDLQQDMFKAFKRGADRHPRTGKTGLGLGLYIASEIVAAHNGTLTLDCRDGLVVFTVVLDTSQSPWPRGSAAQ